MHHGRLRLPEVFCGGSRRTTELLCDRCDRSLSGRCVVAFFDSHLDSFPLSDGTDRPARFKIRGRSFSNLQCLTEMARGEHLPDLVATLGSLDTIMGEVDR